MIEYDSKNWISVIFHLHKTHLLKALFPSVLAVGIYTGFFIYFYELNFSTIEDGTTVLHSLLGFVLGLLLVFRTNTSYDKWWEARKLWGSLVNNIRNLSIKLNTFIDDQKEKKELNILISNFPFLLKKHLRDEKNIRELRTLNGDLLINNESEHKPIETLNLLYKKIRNYYHDKKISGEELIIIDTNLNSLLDITGACERIKNTPIPYSYNVHIKKYIVIYILSLPWGLMHEIGYWAVPAVMLIFYAMVGIELIAEQIEDPFGYDPDDLPLDKISNNIQKNVDIIFS